MGTVRNRQKTGKKREWVRVKRKSEGSKDGKKRKWSDTERWSVRIVVDG